MMVPWRIADRDFSIGKKKYGRTNVLTIAEIGTAHGGDRSKAQDLVDAAVESGADCVKFQIVHAEEILHPNTGEVPLPGGNIRLFDRFKALETPLDFFARLKEYTENKGVLFLCTPFGLRSARELRSLRVKAMKIASPELNYAALAEEIASYNLPTFLSSGVSRLADIEGGIDFFPRDNVCLLHCVTAYPAPEIDYNLRVLPNLRGIFGVAVGVSDHSLDAELIPALATAAGACAVEKHFCLSRDDDGLDDPIALPPKDFARMVRAVREASACGSDATVDSFAKERGEELVAAILGDGAKRLSQAEKANYQRTNRSIHAIRDISEGEIIEADDIACLRTEKILRPGLAPSWEKLVIGRAARAPIPAGEGIRFEDI